MDTDIAGRIERLKAERNAVILAHNYCIPEVQDIADHVGDSLGLSIIASGTNADVIVFCGVSFMAESAKILSPGKTVLIPEPDAHCPMASMCSASQIIEHRAGNPDDVVIGYVNSTAAAKAEMDICCTSSNAVNVARSVDGPILFVPDRNLGAYVRSKVGGHVGLWDGYCPTHQAITPEMIADLKKKYPDAAVLAHPECRMSVLDVADHVGSTEYMLKIASDLDIRDIIVATEKGMLHRLEKANPKKRFHFPEPAVCPVMKMTTLRSVMNALERMDCVVSLDEKTMERARIPLQRMIGIK